MKPCPSTRPSAPRTPITGRTIRRTSPASPRRHASKRASASGSPPRIPVSAAVTFEVPPGSAQTSGMLVNGERSTSRPTTRARLPSPPFTASVSTPSRANWASVAANCSGSRVTT